MLVRMVSEVLAPEGSPERTHSRKAAGLGPLAHSVRPAVGSPEVDDDLAHQAEPHELHPQGEEQYRQEQGGPVRDALALDPLDEEHQH